MQAQNTYLYQHHKQQMPNNFVKIISKKNKYSDIARIVHQYTKFGTIGVVATLVHIGIFVALIEVLNIWEVFANFLAFCIAVGVSFIGHSQWTFKKYKASSEKQHQINKSSFIKFWIVSLSGLIINTVVVFLVTETWQVSYYYAIVFMVTVTPLLIFTASKVWVFK